MMVTTAWTAALLLAFLLPLQVSSLQVSPNSPCASVCVDSSNIDLSDPNSSNTRTSDITCKDAEYTKTPAGIKWQNCMTCLQKSSFYHGSESDQGWFLYNLRYNFNYCVFGYPNNTRIGSNPCQTSRACGALQNALMDGNLDPKSSADYGYCTADGSAMTGEFYAKCLSCIGSFTDQKYVSNGLIALEAGCLQRPAPGKVIGVSDSVFSSSAITIIDPVMAESSSSKSTTPTTTIAIAAIGAVIAVAAIAAITFVCVRKRRNRRARASPGGWGHRPKSSLSFRCRTHLSPMSPQFFAAPNGADSSFGAEDNAPRHIVSSPRSGSAPAAPWRPASSIATSLSPVTEKRGGFDTEPLSALSEKQQIFLSEKQQLHQLTTALPAAPRTVHTSPVATRSSPATATPTSATQLLPTQGRLSSFAPYVPADYAGVRPQQQHHQHTVYHTQSPVSPIVRQPGSPGHTPHQWGWAVTTGNAAAVPSEAAPPPPSKSPRMSNSGFMGRKASRESGSPVETVAIQTAFPGPPRR